MQFTALPTVEGEPEMDAGRIEAFLKARGADVTSVSVKVDPETGAVHYEIDASDDPGKLLENYIPPVTPTRAATLQLRGLRQKMESGTATLADIRQALVALVQLVDVDSGR